MERRKPLTPEHLLLRKAQTRPQFAGDLTPPGCHYDIRLGTWIVSSKGSLLVETHGHPVPRTKKEDIETGEDQKSE